MHTSRRSIEMVCHSVASRHDSFWQVFPRPVAASLNVVYLSSDFLFDPVEQAFMSMATSSFAASRVEMLEIYNWRPGPLES